jgi:hypothetical protein
VHRLDRALGNLPEVDRRVAFAGTPIDDTLARDLAGGGFLAQ